MLDRGTRAERNAEIAEGNRHPNRRRSPLYERIRLEQEKLRAAQTKVLKVMYGEQKLDRDALREVHHVELGQHKDWAHALYAGARKAAFDEVREQNAPKWEAIRTIADPARRDEAGKALRSEQKKLYDQVSRRHVGQARPQKDEAWQALRKKQFEERNELREVHRQEYSALIRQHTAERLGVGERCRAEDLQKRGDRLSARFAGNQGMVAQQRAAQQAIRLSHRASRDNASVRPADISITLMKIAAGEHDKRGVIRGSLNAWRQTNQLRTAAPDRFRAQAGTAMLALDRVVNSDPHAQARQAAASDRTLSSEERANAPKDVRDRLDHQDRKALTERSLPASHQQQNRGKDRGGGGRGR